MSEERKGGRKESNVLLGLTTPRRLPAPELFTLAAGDTFLDFQNNGAMRQGGCVRPRGKQGSTRTWQVST